MNDSPSDLDVSPPPDPHTPDADAPMSRSTLLARGISLIETRGWYHIQFRDRSRTPPRKTVALNTDDASIAHERARDKMRRYELGTYDPWMQGDERAVTIGEALDAYARSRRGAIKDRSIQDVTYKVEQFARALPPAVEYLEQVTSRHVRRFCFRPDIARATQASCRRLLNVFFNWAAGEGLIKSNPVADVPKPQVGKRRPKYFTEEQLDRLLKAVELRWEENKKHVHRDYANPLWLQDVYELAASAGLRRSECENLCWGDVIWPERNEVGKVTRPGQIVVRARGAFRPKNDEDDVVTMIPRAEVRLAYLELEFRQTSDPAEPVLKKIDGTGPIAGDYASRRFPVICDYAGLPNITFHGLRHTFACMCRMRGMELQQLREEMRHKDISTTMKYGAIGPTERARATLRLFSGGDPF